MSRDIKDDRRNRNDGRGARSHQDDEDVQRAIEGLKDIPDDELQEFLDDEDFNIVDTWEGDEEHHEDGINRNDRGRDGRRHSRDRYRRRRGGSSIRDHRDRSRRDDRRREEGMRRDPSKSSKDIERDKMRAKRDSDSKILAEKEKAIKHLLDSDTVVPPGTEEEALENERILDRSPRKSREHRRSPPDRRRISPPRRRSHDRIRHSPPLHRERSPFIPNPERKRSLERRRSSERNRRMSWDRRHSTDRRDRRITPDRSRRRVEERIVVRRSRSRDRHRSRSFDRLKRRSSRSPGRRGSPRRRTLSKSPDRRRKRSPFINEIARQFRDEALRAPTGGVSQFVPAQGLLPTPVHPVPPPATHYLSMLDPVMGLPPQTPGHFISTFEPQPPPQPMGFDPVPPMLPLPHEYNAPPVMYNQPTFGTLPVPSPQPVPAPVLDQPLYNPVPAPLHRSPSPKRAKFPDTDHYDRERDRNRGPSSHNGGAHHSRSERLKTPEPPVISDSKPFEKTSLSSLLEASVSAKDSGYPVLYPGYKPEILRKCEMALRELPDEDPRLKMSGRFFFDPTKEEPKISEEEFVSNSILVQRTRNIIVWDEEPPAPKKPEVLPQKPEMSEKWTQTEELIVEDNGTQTITETLDFCVQVCPGELDPPREEKRTIMDRLDWNVRESNDYSPARNTEDLRWSLNNSRSWNRGSPSRQDRESRGRSRERSHHDRDSRGFDLSPLRSREKFAGRNRNFNSRERFSPKFRRSVERQEDFRDSRSRHSRDNSPEVLDDEDDVEIVEESFSRESSWRGRNKSFGNTKPRGSRGKHPSGRPYRGRGGGFRGKF